MTLRKLTATEIKRRDELMARFKGRNPHGYDPSFVAEILAADAAPSAAGFDSINNLPRARHTDGEKEDGK